MEHSFNVELAKIYGIEEAIIINNLFYWINKNCANDKHFYNGRYWTFNSTKAFSELFPYMSKSKINRVLINLEAKDFILKDNFNENKMLRTCWYAFTDNAICILQKIGLHLLKSENANEHNEECTIYTNNKLTNNKPNIKYSDFSKNEESSLNDQQEEKEKSSAKKENSAYLTDFNASSDTTTQLETESGLNGLKSAITQEDIDKVYSAYPTRCAIRGASLGKTTTNKNQIRKLLKEHSADELVLIIQRYTTECITHKVFMKGFGTFLNNLPDYTNLEPANTNGTNIIQATNRCALPQNPVYTDYGLD